MTGGVDVPLTQEPDGHETPGLDLPFPLLLKKIRELTGRPFEGYDEFWEWLRAVR